MSKFDKYVSEAVKGVVDSHRHNHPLYKPTRMLESIVDTKREKAAFVLFEQIDTDRLTSEADELLRQEWRDRGYNDAELQQFMPPDSEGWLGDQYRFSVWYINGTQEPRQLFEDHAYIRKTVSQLTDSVGRDAAIHLESLLENGIVARISDESSKDAYAKKLVKITFDGDTKEYSKLSGGEIK